VLQTASVRSAQQQALTPPKLVEPDMDNRPVGARPETSMLRGPAGSSLFTVMVPV
jgi:hypothetical protein